MEVGFYHGILPCSYEEQANRQGFTLGEYGDKLEKSREACNTLLFQDYLTESQAKKVYEKIQKEIVKHLKPIRESEDVFASKMDLEEER